VQAINFNLLAVIFIPLREQYGLTYAQFGTLIFVIFISQIFINVALSKPIDRIGVRPFIIPALCVCIGGMILFAMVPDLLPGHIYAGFMGTSLLIAAGGGVLELCLSPIVDAIPRDAADSSKALSFLHSFYAWGQAVVVLLTSGLLFLGVSWRVIALAWALVPAADVILFYRAPIAERATGDDAMPIRKLLSTGIFIVALITIGFGGASEANIAQYASAFLEKGLGMDKLAGDILGLCGFAVFLGVGRMLYGFLGDKININTALIGGSALAFAAYLVIAFSPAGAAPVAAIALCGLFVSLLWPGTLAIVAKGLPLAGASMFALLAASGSLGCSIGPWVGGQLTDIAMRSAPEGLSLGLLELSAEQFGLRAGLLAAAFFPLASFAFQLYLKRVIGKKT